TGLPYFEIISFGTGWRYGFSEKPFRALWSFEHSVYPHGRSQSSEYGRFSKTSKCGGHRRILVSRKRAHRSKRFFSNNRKHKTGPEKSGKFVKKPAARREKYRLQITIEACTH